MMEHAKSQALVITCYIVLLSVLCVTSGCGKVYLEPAESVPVGKMFKAQNPEPPQAYHAESQSEWTGWNRFWAGSALLSQTTDAVIAIDGLGNDCHGAGGMITKNGGSGEVVVLKLAGAGLAVWVAEWFYAGDPQQQQARNWIYGILAVSGAGTAVWNYQQECGD